MGVGGQATDTELIVTGTVTETLALSDLVVSCVEVAVMVVDAEAETVAGAV